jgi:hypothetical protein
MKLLPAIERIFNVTLHLLACVVLWGCLTGGAAWAQYSDDLKDIQHDIGDIHVFPGFHEPRPIGHLGEVDSVVDLRGFVPMSLSSKTAGGWLTNLRWYKIPTRKALLLLYFGTLSVSHVADDTTSLEKRFSKTSFLKESNVNAESKLWCKVAYNSAKDSAAIYQQIAGGSGLQGAEPTTIFLTPESAFVILNFKYISTMTDNGQILVALEFSRLSRRYKTFYELYSTMLARKSIQEMFAATAPIIAKALIDAGVKAATGQ